MEQLPADNTALLLSITNLGATRRHPCRPRFPRCRTRWTLEPSPRPDVSAPTASVIVSDATDPSGSPTRGYHPTRGNHQNRSPGRRSRSNWTRYAVTRPPATVERSSRRGPQRNPQAGTHRDDHWSYPGSTDTWSEGTRSPFGKESGWDRGLGGSSRRSSRPRLW